MRPAGRTLAMSAIDLPLKAYKNDKRGSERRISLLRQGIFFTSSKLSFLFITTSKISIFLVHHYYENQKVEKNEKNIKILSFV
jgi:hypothetical protein